MIDMQSGIDHPFQPQAGQRRLSEKVQHHRVRVGAGMNQLSRRAEGLFIRVGILKGARIRGQRDVEQRGLGLGKLPGQGDDQLLDDLTAGGTLGVDEFRRREVGIGRVMIDGKIHLPVKALWEEILRRDIHGDDILRHKVLRCEKLVHKGQHLFGDLRVMVQVGLFVLSSQRTAKGGGTHYGVAVRIFMRQEQDPVLAAEQLRAFRNRHGSSSAPASSASSSSS